MIKSMTYAGHSAVLFETSIGTVAIDPWLYENPRTPENLKNLKELELICLTHGHSDHAGNALRLAKQYGSTVCATWELAQILIKEGLPDWQVQPMNKGGTVEHKGLKVTLTNAFHSSSYDLSSGVTVYAGEACGVVLRDGRTSIYHAGDTCLFGDMTLIGQLYAPTVALLPIGDRFTMDPKQAALAASMLGCKLAMPLHYATFSLLTGSAADFSNECRSRGIESLVLEPGQSHKF